MPKRYLSIFLSLALSAVLTTAGCRSTRPAADLELIEAPVGFTEMTDSLPPDPAVEALVAPYRESLRDRIEEVIGEAAGLLEKGSPEGALGNMAADAMLYAVNGTVDRPVNMALTNNGGLRVPIAAGPITVGKVFELMPFENMTVVLDLTGVQVDSLAQQIARAGGEPIAGFRFAIDADTRTAHDVQVGGAPLEPGRLYRLATSDYLADGGGNMPALWNPTDRENLNLLLRDAFIQYVRHKGTIEPMLDGRISFEER